MLPIKPVLNYMNDDKYKMDPEEILETGHDKNHVPLWAWILAITMLAIAVLSWFPDPIINFLTK